MNIIQQLQSRLSLVDSMNLNKLIRVVLLVVTISLPNKLLSQINFQNHTIINIDNGLSQNDIRCMFRDSDGFIWIGTSDGLNRYDGKNIKAFTSDTTNNISFNNYVFNSICEDNNKCLYIGTEKGINIYNKKTETSTILCGTDSTNQSLYNPRQYILSLEIDELERLWIGTDNGLIIYDIRAKKFQKFGSLINRHTELCNNTISKIYKDSKKNIWIAYNKCLFKYDIQKNKLDSFFLDCNKQKDEINNTIYSIYEDMSSNIWLGTNHGLIKMYNPDLKFDKYLFQKPISELNTFEISDIIQINNNTYLISTSNYGLYTYDYKKDKCIPLPIINTSDYSCLLHYQGTLFIGSKRDGLIKVNTHQKPFKQINKIKNQVKGNINASRLFHDSNGNIWVGTYDGVFVWEKDKKGWSSSITKLNKETQTNKTRIVSILEVSQNKFWFGTFSGIVTYDTKTKNVDHISRTNETNKNQLVNNLVIAMAKDKDNNIWIGTGQGISIYNTKNKTFKNFNVLFEDSTKRLHQVSCIFKTKNNDMWVGTKQGLLKYIPNDSTFKLCSINKQKEKIIQEIVRIDEDDEGNLWLATAHLGLVYFNTKTEEYRSILIKRKLGSNLIYALKNFKNCVWFSAVRGIGRYDKNNGNIEAYTKPDGIQNGEFNSTVTSINDSLIAFGGTNGITFFNPKTIKTDTLNPKIVLTKLEIASKEILANREYNGYTPIKGNINIADEITLNHRDNIFSVSFAALDYKAAKKIEYAYILEGLSDKLIYYQHNNKINFSGLKPGDYKLIIKATNSDGIWSKHSKTINIIIKPPWWQTWWFYLLAIVFLVIIIIVFINLRIYKLKETENILKKRVEIRTEEIYNKQEEINVQKELIEGQNEQLKNYALNLENEIEIRLNDVVQARNEAEEANRLKSAFIANISHEIRTPLNSIIGFSELLNNPKVPKEDRTRYVNIIKDGGYELLALFDKLMNTSMIESKQLRLNKAPFNPNTIIDKLHAKYKKKAKIISEDIELNTYKDRTEDTFQINSDASRITQILNYMINNALLYTENGRIDFGYKFKEPVIEFFVKDTGIGIEENKLEAIFTRFEKAASSEDKLYRGIGLGLTISKDLVEMLGGKIWVNSTPNKGSSFYFSIPIND